MGRGTFEEGGVSHCKVYGHSADIYAKTAEPIEMPFGLWACMGPGNHVLDGDPEYPWEWAIIGEMGAHVKYRDTLRSPGRKQLTDRDAILIAGLDWPKYHKLD